MEKVKQVIVVRNDLKMSKGKMSAQVAHASLGAFLVERYTGDGYRGNVICIEETDAKEKWINGSFFKIVLKVDSEEELLEIKKKCDTEGIENKLICDEGHTVFSEPTNTCLGIGPDFENKIDKITGHLKLMN